MLSSTDVLAPVLTSEVDLVVVPVWNIYLSLEPELQSDSEAVVVSFGLRVPYRSLEPTRKGHPHRPP